jgi:hypothetical protein
LYRPERRIAVMCPQYSARNLWNAEVVRMPLSGVVLLVAGATFSRADERVSRMLERLSEEAAAFAQAAPNLIAEETLRQRAIKPVHRRFGDIHSADEDPPEWQSREIVSEYTYAPVASESGNIREFRKVLSVDGRTIETSAKAIDALARGMRSDDEHTRLRLLQAFTKYGLIGTVTDIGQMILLFERRNLERYEFEPAGSTLIGADRCLIFSYQQLEGPETLTVWQGSKTARNKLAGKVMVREPDYQPVRITFASVIGDGEKAIREEGQVDYEQGRYGTLVPVSVVHREYRMGQLTAENVFSYTAFRRFGSSSGIRFEGEPAENTGK